MKGEPLTAIELIAFERARQEDKGYTEEHDDKYIRGELAFAAASYAYYAGWPRVPMLWPWEDSKWKPDRKEPIHNLIKAGALIAAEIDRRLRQDQQCTNDTISSDTTENSSEPTTTTP
jgi:hypothetical protein